MGFLSFFLDSSVLMGILTVVFSVFCLRCLIYGTMAGTSAILRVVLTIVFAALAYFCWNQAVSVHGSNMIDNFVFDAWSDVKHLFVSIKQNIF